MLHRFFLFSFFLLFTTNSLARVWDKHTIPNAYCADGSDYTIFISPGTDKNLHLRLSGGNACWDYESCYKKEYANLTTVEQMGDDDYFMVAEESPIKNSTLVFMTYCTGDVHIGDHEANYDGIITKHHGRKNIEETLKYLKNYFHNYRDIDRVSVHGASAGAIGLLYHMHGIKNDLSSVPNKSLLLDGTGLHFGDSFWERFSPEMLFDLSDAIELNGVLFDPGKGNVSAAIPGLCRQLPSWRVGAFQGARDIVMRFFGNISSRAHKALVYGDSGILAHTQDAADNCAAFIPNTSKHTFLKREKNSKQRARELVTNQRKTAMQFAVDIVNGVENATYR